MENYTLVRPIGSGTFGVVSLGLHLPTSTFVALKKIRIKSVRDGLPKVLMREIQALEKLNAEAESTDSRHVVKMKEYFAIGASVIIVLEYMTTDMQMLMKSMADIGCKLDDKHIKLIMWMCVKGVEGVHKQKVMHRDLKPSNFLFSPSGCLKVGDFGLARINNDNVTSTTTSSMDGLVITSSSSTSSASAPAASLASSSLPLTPSSSSSVSCPNYSHEVATRWYRSPELLFGSRSYGFPVDLWALGCVFSELLSGSVPLVPGQSDIDQLYRVLLLRGTPSSENWPLHAQLPDWGKISFPHLRGLDLRGKVHPSAASGAVDLLERMLALDPARRITAAQARSHPYFDEIRKDEAKGGKHKIKWHQENLMSLVRFPSLSNEWKSQQNAESSSDAASSSSAHCNDTAKRRTDAEQNNQYRHDAPSPSSSSSSHASSLQSSSGIESDQLASMHLTGLEWSSLSTSSYNRSIRQLPSHQSINRLREDFTIDQICAY